MSLAHFLAFSLSPGLLSPSLSFSPFLCRLAAPGTTWNGHSLITRSLASTPCLPGVTWVNPTLTAFGGVTFGTTSRALANARGADGGPGAEADAAAATRELYSYGLFALDRAKGAALGAAAAAAGQPLARGAGAPPDDLDEVSTTSARSSLTGATGRTGAKGSVASTTPSRPKVVGAAAVGGKSRRR